MSNKTDVAEIENLKKEVEQLKSDLDQLREFVKSLYSMIEGEEQYGSPEGMLGPDFRGINT